MGRPARSRSLVSPEPLRPYNPHGRNRLLPRDIERVEVEPDVARTIQEVSLSIFTDMSNNNYSFREAIAAVYLSGLQHGSELARESRS